MSPFSPNYISQLAPTRSVPARIPVIVPLPRNPQARIAEKQESREDKIRRGCSMANGAKA